MNIFNISYSMTFLSIIRILNSCLHIHFFIDYVNKTWLFFNIPLYDLVIWSLAPKNMFGALKIMDHISESTHLKQFHYEKKVILILLCFWEVMGKQNLYFYELNLVWRIKQLNNNIYIYYNNININTKNKQMDYIYIHGMANGWSQLYEVSISVVAESSAEEGPEHTTENCDIIFSDFSSKLSSSRSEERRIWSFDLL